jgi:hypothetical protein
VHQSFAVNEVFVIIMSDGRFSELCGGRCPDGPDHDQVIWVRATSGAPVAPPAPIKRYAA